MCGISLLVNKKESSIPFDYVKSMNERVVHRGPDGEGFHFGKNFAMGHRRLSIVDLSDSGHQPMQKSKDYIVFNGMIYNYIELRRELINAGHSFQSDSDTEVLITACRQWGVNAFEKLNGMWAFAWYIHDKKEIIICRDRYGIKPLYITEREGFFAAASEIKQFLDLPGFRRKLNYIAAVDYLTDGWLNHTDQTFFDGVLELRPGCYIKYNLLTHKHTLHKWYDLNDASKSLDISRDQAEKKTRDLLSNAVSMRMRSDVKIGSCLSGGIDSSSIVSVVDKMNLANKDFATITSCYKDNNYDEQEYSDIITQKTGLTAHKIFPNLDDLFGKGDLNKMVYSLDQPFSTLSHYSEFKVFETASKYGFKVMMDGQGADEYLYGYEEFYTSYLKSLLKKFRFSALFKALIARSKTNRESFISTTKAQIKSAYFFPIIATIKKIIGRSETPWLKPAFSRLAKTQRKLFDADKPRNLSLMQMQFSSLPYQLHSQDRNTMRFSIESRTPFLDHRLVEFIIGLPDDLKINKGFSKHILRSAMDVIPEEIRWRTQKMGFVAPDEWWVRKNSDVIRAELTNVIDKTGMFSLQLLKRFDKFIEGKLQYEPIYLRAITLNRFIAVFNMQFNQNDLKNSIVLNASEEFSYKRA